MMEKLLPIKFFEKRKIDEQLTEAGGSSNPPKWVMQGDDLNQRAQHLTGGMEQVSTKFEEHKAEKRTLPMVMVTTMIEDAIAKSHRGAVVDLLNSDNNSNVIGIEPTLPRQAKSDSAESMIPDDKDAEPQGERRLLSMVTTDELIENINLALRDSENNAKLISSIADIEPFEPQSSEYNPENKTYHVRLIDYQDSHQNQVAQRLFKNQCVAGGIIIEKETRYSSDMKLYRISLDSVSCMETVCGFEGVSSIEEAIPIRVDKDAFDDMAVPAGKNPEEGESYPTIGVLDSGIKKNRYLAPWLLDTSEMYYEEDLVDKSHGSMVASVLEYADELNGTNYSATDGVMMLEAAVVPDLHKEEAYPDDIIDNVRDVIERHKDIKIWTMSVGTSEESDLNSFSEYGMALDNIADENDVLIIKSAGNNTKYTTYPPNKRIAKMADSVRSLVVGSIAGEKEIYDFADINMPSPFTRCGPGPSYVIKPDLVAYGGNSGVRPDGKSSITGVKVFDIDGKPERAAGTSFSTPWVARIAAELNFLLDGDFDPLLIKALMVHNSGYPVEGRMTMEDKKKYMGFGMPSGAMDILYNSENEITLILRDKLPKGNFIEILDFPFSGSMIGGDGMYHGQIALTMVGNPILRPSEGPEYCQSDIKVAFGTMAGIKERDTTQRTIRNLYGADDSANLMRDDFYKKQFFDVLEDETSETGEIFGRERTLLRLGQKYYPIKKYAIDLDEMKNASKKKYLSGDRKWYMKVETLFRDAVEREAKKTGEVLEQEFCILLTIRDPSGKIPVYNEVTQQLQEKNFVYSNVRLKNEIREHVHVEAENNG